MRTVFTCICLLIVGSSGALAQTLEPDIAVMPDSFDYEVVIVGEVRNRAFAVSNEDTTASLIVFATEIQGEDADQFQITGGGSAFVLAPGAIRLVSVRFAPTALGPKNAILRFESNDPDENPLDVTLSGTGSGFPNISANRTTVSFGSVLVGSTTFQEVILSNQGLADLEVTATALTGPNADLFNIVEETVPFTLASQERDTLLVSFTPLSNGDKSARLGLFSNDPDENPLEVVLAGRGISSDITVDSTGHDFGEVPLGSSAAFTFFISNTGTASLVVDSLLFQGPGVDQFGVTGGAPPFTIGLGGTRQLTVQFVPAAQGPQSAVLSLFSNDPDEPQLDLTLRGTTLIPDIAVSAPSIEFGELLTGLNTAQTVILTNTGRANLSVVQQSITGGDSTQFLLDARRTPFSLAPSDSLFLSVRFIPTSGGAKQSILRLISNDLDQPELDIPLSGLASTIQVDVRDVAALGEDIVITFTLPQGFQPETKALFYRSAGETAFRTTELTGTGPDFQGTVPGLVVQLSGIEYYMRVSVGDGVVTVPAFEPQNRPLFLPVQIDRLEAPVSPQAWTYQMISVPLELADQDVGTVLLDDYGPYNTRRWRLFRWENDDYVEYPAIKGSFAAGVGFWLITNDGAPFDVENGQSSDLSDPFIFTLQPGWNQIGNPFAFPITWPGDLIDPRIEAPVSYDGIEFQYGQTVLRPWEGYFVRNLASSPITVSLLGRASRAGKSEDEAGKLAIHGGIEYRLRLFAEVEGEQLLDTQNYLGLAETSSEGHDTFDFTEAPPIGDYVRFSIVEDGERYAGNVKPAKEGGQYWDLEVDGTFSGKSVRVRLASMGHLPEDYGLYVVDKDNRNAIAVVDSSFSIDMYEAFHVRHLQIFMGTRQYIEAHRDEIPLVPVAFRMEQNYPNPFNPETTIRYQISKQTPVRLEIYNLMGQRVRILVHTTLEAGSYATRWDGRNDEGMSVASGVYMYRLHAGEFMATRKMLLIR